MSAARTECVCAPVEFRVGRLVLVPSSRSLIGPKGRARLQPQVCAVARRLMEQPNTFVSRAELLAAMRMAGSQVEVSSEEVLRSAIFKLRMAVAALGCSPDTVATVRTVGHAIQGRVVTTDRRMVASPAEQRSHSQIEMRS